MANQLLYLNSVEVSSVYQNVFNELIKTDEENRLIHGKLAKDMIYLPSDNHWQDKVYNRLLEAQKRVNELTKQGITADDDLKIKSKNDKQIWDPINVLECLQANSNSAAAAVIDGLFKEDGNDRIGSCKYNQNDGTLTRRKLCVPDHPIEFIDVNMLGSWNLETISKAGKLLRKPPIPVHFEDEHNMRKVYSLIYDVFRYKHVLSQALNDISFYGSYPHLKQHENRIWLLLFELYSRHFLKRQSEESELQNSLFKEADLEDIAKKLWDHRVKLAASVSRIRIKNGALHLSQLLPAHLQNEKVAIAACNPIVSGWINPFKVKNKNDAIGVLGKMGMKEVTDTDNNEEKPLQLNQYKWDKVCPLFISCLPNDRGEFAKSNLVKNNIFVLQDRTFSIAPAILSRLLDHFDLDGDIVQTHVSSPRSTAYLAALFHSVNRVNDFLAFGCGLSISEYKEYVNHLGISNIRLFPESFCSVPLESDILETVVGIFATPPNSFSGVADPIDLICSRGGDLTMLEVLTESKISQEGKRRVKIILEEQRETLRMAMSRPQVQFILYETHSIVGSENQDMVEKSVEIINKSSFEKHLEAYKEQKRLEELAAAELANVPQVALSSPRKRAGNTSAKADSAKNRNTKETKEVSRKNSIESINADSIPSTDPNFPEDFSSVIKIPKTDEFRISDVPDICLNQDRCLNFNEMGCYVSLIHRTQITKLDAKYLIKMAETRGLFGSAESKKNSKLKALKRVDKKPDKNSADNKNKSKKTDINNIVQRINQPTHASFIRSNLQKISFINKQSLKFNSMNRDCSRHIKYNMDEYPCTTTVDLNNRAKRWWHETTKYINTLQNEYQTQRKLCNTSNLCIGTSSSSRYNKNSDNFNINNNNNNNYNNNKYNNVNVSYSNASCSLDNLNFQANHNFNRNGSASKGNHSKDIINYNSIDYHNINNYSSLNNIDLQANHKLNRNGSASKGNHSKDVNNYNSSNYNFHNNFNNSNSNNHNNNNSNNSKNSNSNINNISNNNKTSDIKVLTTNLSMPTFKLTRYSNEANLLLYKPKKINKVSTKIPYPVTVKHIQLESYYPRNMSQRYEDSGYWTV